MILHGSLVLLFFDKVYDNEGSIVAFVVPVMPCIE